MSLSVSVVSRQFCEAMYVQADKHKLVAIDLPPLYVVALHGESVNNLINPNLGGIWGTSIIKDNVW